MATTQRRTAAASSTLPLPERPPAATAGDQKCTASDPQLGHCTKGEHPPDDPHRFEREHASGTQGAATGWKPCTVPGCKLPACAPMEADNPAAQPAPAAKGAPAAQPAAAPAPQPAAARPVVPASQAPRPGQPLQGKRPVQAPPPARMVPLVVAAAAVAATPVAPGWRMVMGGMRGIGKTTFGVDSDAPIFIPAERSPNVPAHMQFPVPNTWGEILDAVRYLLRADHKWRTLVLDTIDAANGLCVNHIKAKTKVGDGGYLSDVGGGYNKGKEALTEEWRPLLAMLERLATERGMNVLLLGHTKVGKPLNPDGLDFPGWELEVEQTVAGLITGWGDISSMAYKEIRVERQGKRGPAKGTATGPRWLNLAITATASWCKNRYNLPDRLSLGFDTFAAAMAHVNGNAALFDEIRMKAALLQGHSFRDRQGTEHEYFAWTEAQLGANPPPMPHTLAKIASRLQAVMDELGIVAPDEQQQQGQPPPDDDTPAA